MKKIITGLLLYFFVVVCEAASIGYAIPTSLLQESNVLHVEFAPDAPKTGLPSCASRTYIDLSTDAGKTRAAIAIAAFNEGREVYVYIADGLTTCSWSSSVPNNWIRVRR